jgi:hypothetical protein
MKKEVLLRHEFVEFIPDDLQERTIYISIRFATVTHLCCCGCGGKVITPLRPTDWKLIFDGKTVSLDPSIGNWSFQCKSHYWISNNRTHWSQTWSPEKIEAVGIQDRRNKQKYFHQIEEVTVADKPGEGRTAKGFWQKLKKLWSR